MTEDILQDRADRPVVRIGDTVRHLAHPWSAATRQLLLHLEAIDFPYAPRFLGIDEQGRDALTYIAGDSGRDGWSRIVDERGLRNLAALLRDYHQAVKWFRPSTELAPGGPPPSDDDIVCHGDPGAWNVVWDGIRPVGLLDWEYAVHAPARYDIGYALNYAVPFRDDATTVRWHHFPELPDRRHRLTAFAAAYGLDSTDGLLEAMLDAQRMTIERVRRLAAAGAPRQVAAIRDGGVEADEAQLRWCEQHRDLLG
ncbi:MAG: phosphotransferase [Mycobacteriales bacterium]